MPKIVIRISFVVLGALVLGLLYLLLKFPRSASYSVSATTEVASVVVADERGINARLPVVSVVRGGQKQSPLCCSVRLAAPKGTSLRFARRSTGELLILVRESPGSSERAQLEKPDGSAEPLQDGDVLHVGLTLPTTTGGSEPTPETVLLAFHGELRLGDDVGPAVERTLLGGNVRVVERDFFTGERYIARDTALDPGDEVVWDATSANSPALVAGFIHVGEDKAIQVAANAAAPSVSVVRFGAPTYHITPSIFDRIARDPSSAAIIAFLASIAGLATLLDILYRVLESFTGWHER